MLTIILWLDPGPLPRPSTATWLDTLPVDSSSINRRATGSPWITRAGGGPERGALSTTEGCSPWPASLCGSPVPPKEHGLKVMAQEGGRSFPAACGQMRVGRPAGRWPDRRGTGVFPPPHRWRAHCPHPPGKGSARIAGGPGARAPEAGAAPGPQPAGRVPADPAPHLRGRLPRRLRRHGAGGPAPRRSRGCRSRDAAPARGPSRGPRFPGGLCPAGRGPSSPARLRGQGPGRAWGAGLGDWFGGGRRLGGPGYPRECSPAGPGAGAGVLGLGRGGAGKGSRLLPLELGLALPSVYLFIFRCHLFIQMLLLFRFKYNWIFSAVF